MLGLEGRYLNALQLEGDGVLRDMQSEGGFSELRPGATLPIDLLGSAGHLR